MGGCVPGARPSSVGRRGGDQRKRAKTARVAPADFSTPDEADEVDERPGFFFLTIFIFFFFLKFPLFLLMVDFLLL